MNVTRMKININIWKIFGSDSIENLRDKDEINLETYLKSNSIDYKKWPNNIKDELKLINIQKKLEYLNPKILSMINLF